jgi:GNAT superfamily N-acetyltransferase
VTPVLIEAVRRDWEHLAGAPAGFATGRDVGALVSPGSRLCPAGWCGIVRIGDETLATAPDEDRARELGAALRRLPAGQHTDPDVLRRRLPVVEVLGPAHLAYREPSPLEATTTGDELHVVDALDPLAQGLLRNCPAEDVGESGMAGIDSPAFVLTCDGEPVAASGYEFWPRDVAHLCVLVRPDARGRSLARVVATRATAHAQFAGLRCQWRARPAASLRVAQALGYDVLGAQLSLRW